MTAISLGSTLTIEAIGNNLRSHSQSQQASHEGVVTDEIEGLIRVYDDGHVERPQIVPFVSCALPPALGVTSRDTIIDELTNVWARIYAPSCRQNYSQLPLILYFHGGGFCVGSAAWSCYHAFLAELASKASCLILSVNYRLAPEHPLPAAYEDGFKALRWLQQQFLEASSEGWTSQCDLSRLFLGGDSAGANIAHHLASTPALDKTPELEATAAAAAAAKRLRFRGTILIQPFFGGEVRTESEKRMVQLPCSALSVASSDTYWRLALPRGSNRDHPWCNPLMIRNGTSQNNKLEEQPMRELPNNYLVCISERDILRDRNVEYCNVLVRAGNKLECMMYEGVGHGFQILSKSRIAQSRTQEMVSHVKAFVHR